MRYIGVVIIRPVEGVCADPKLHAYQAMARVSIKTPKPHRSGFDAIHRSLVTHPLGAYNLNDDTLAAWNQRSAAAVEQLNILCHLLLENEGFGPAEVELARASANFLLTPGKRFVA